MSIDNMRRIVRKTGLNGLIKGSLEIMDCGLVASAGNNIYCLDKNFKKWLVAKRSSRVLDLAYCDSKLYDAGEYRKIFDTLTAEVIADRLHEVQTITSHQGELYDAGAYKTVHQTLEGSEVVKRLHWIHAITSFHEQLYDASSTQLIRTATSTVIVERRGTIRALCAHQEQLYDAGQYGWILDSFSQKAVANREENVYALASHNGKLYDGGRYQSIFDTLEDFKGENPLWVFEENVQAIQSIPLTLWEKLASGEKQVLREKVGMGRK